MSRLFDCSDASTLMEGMRLARTAIARGELAVIPTDTVYGVAADAFSPAAVARLLAAKGRDRSAPPPVLVADVATLHAVAEDVPEPVQALAEAFWPGGLTIVVHARSSLAWDLGDARGTVAVRIPDHPVALELLRETGPLAVSSANRTGMPAAVTGAEALAALGESVTAVLDAGQVGGVASTIVDATQLRDGGNLRVLRAGAVPRERIADVVGAEHLEGASL